jgi:hypothetical protein
MLPTRVSSSRSSLPHLRRLRSREDVGTGSTLLLSTVIAAFVISSVAKAAGLVERVQVVETPGLDVQVTVRGERAPTFQVFRLPGQGAFAIELPGADLSRALKELGGAQVLFAAAEVDGKSATPRVVLRFFGEVDYDARASGPDLHITFHPLGDKAALRAAYALRQGQGAAVDQARLATADVAALEERQRRAQQELSALERRVGEARAGLGQLEQQRLAEEKRTAALEERSRGEAKKRQAADEQRRVADEELATRRAEEERRLWALASQRAEAERETERALAEASAARLAAETARAELAKAKDDKRLAEARSAVTQAEEELGDKKRELDAMKAKAREQQRLAATLADEAERYRKALAALAAERTAEEAALAALRERRVSEESAAKRLLEDGGRREQLARAAIEDQLAAQRAEQGKAQRRLEELSAFSAQEERRLAALQSQRSAEEARLAAVRKDLQESERRLSQAEQRRGQLADALTRSQQAEFPTERVSVAPPASSSPPLGFGGKSIELDRPNRYQAFAHGDEPFGGEESGRGSLSHVTVQRTGGGSRVGVRVDGGARYTVRRGGERQVLLTLFDTRAANLEVRRILDARDLGTSVLRVLPRVLESDGYRVELTIELREAAAVRVSHDDAMLWLQLG